MGVCSDSIETGINVKTNETQQNLMDKATHIAMSKITAGLSPSALSSAYSDWAVHLASSPGKQAELLEKAMKKTGRLFNYMSHCGLSQTRSQAPPCIEPLAIDKRFVEEEWQKWPFNLYYQAFLLNQQWWSNANTGVRGVEQQHENVVDFTTRQILDVFSPSNYLFTNPKLIAQTRQESGQNLVRGMQNLMQDWTNAINHKKPAEADAFVVGQNIACTPGEVVYRNRLIELIQYKPTTKEVHGEPILIVPAWIMKYYILDLSPENSLVKYLVDQGFTVFMISWKNPDADDRDLGMEDYRQLGIMQALSTIDVICNKAQVHGIGYCLGGTLLSIAAAAMARENDERFKTLTLFAAQTDFTEAGELMLFINESQITFLEDMMWEKGYLDAQQMSGAFQLLRSNDLIWSRLVHDYLMGERLPLNDLMAWNLDTTRMPYQMHSQYLRKLFLNNELAQNKYMVDEKPIAISDIRAPVFIVGTEKDHVAPWQSVYKFHLLSDTDVSFLLTSGGHNAGIVSEPGHPHRSYRMSTTTKEARFTDPQTWFERQQVKAGSWWPELTTWLSKRSSDMMPAPSIGAPEHDINTLCKAPGTYVLQA